MTSAIVGSWLEKCANGSRGAAHLEQALPFRPGLVLRIDRGDHARRHVGAFEETAGEQEVPARPRGVIVPSKTPANACAVSRTWRKKRDGPSRRDRLHRLPFDEEEQDVDRLPHFDRQFGRGSRARWSARCGSRRGSSCGFFKSNAQNSNVVRGEHLLRRASSLVTMPAHCDHARHSTVGAFVVRASSSPSCGSS